MIIPPGGMTGVARGVGSKRGSVNLRRFADNAVFYYKFSAPCLTLIRGDGVGKFPPPNFGKSRLGVRGKKKKREGKGRKGREKWSIKGLFERFVLAGRPGSIYSLWLGVRDVIPPPSKKNLGPCLCMLPAGGCLIFGPSGGETPPCAHVRKVISLKA